MYIHRSICVYVYKYSCFDNGSHSGIMSIYEYKCARVYTYVYIYKYIYICIYEYICARVYIYVDRGSHNGSDRVDTLSHTATHCSILQHTATHCNTL